MKKALMPWCKCSSRSIAFPTIFDRMVNQARVISVLEHDTGAGNVVAQRSGINHWTIVATSSARAMLWVSSRAAWPSLTAAL
jgi:hypothetical protein